MDSVSDLDGVYHLDPSHSALGFTVRHAGLSRIRGAFDDCHGYAIIDGQDAAQSALMVRISVASINTGVPDRDAHLCRDDFFDAATYPAIAFVGLGFEILDDEHVRVTGDLTIRDVTRSLDIDFTYTGGATDPFGNRRIGFEAQKKVSRKDFGLTWNAALETGGWLISDEVVLDLDVSAVQQAGDASLVVDESQIANLALDPTADMVEAELARLAADVEPDGVAVGATEPQPDPEPTPAPSMARRAAEPEEAPVVAARPRRGIVEDEPVRPAHAQEEFEEPVVQPASPDTHPGHAEDDQEGRGSWWKRLTGR